MLRDSLGRIIDYLRLSITDHCNLSCIYCRPFLKKDHLEILSYEEILKVIKVAASLGIKNIRITGGEPLIRKGISDFILELGKIAGINLSLTTNGTFLSNYLSLLKNAGFYKINISLDSLREERYKKITGKDGLERVIGAIRSTKEEGFFVKINTVIMKQINDDEIMSFIRFSEDSGIIVRFIELLPVLGVDWERFFVSLDNCFNGIKKEPIDEGYGKGPARYYLINGAKIGIIQAMSRPFCSSCNRIRLTPDGKIKPCLLDNNEVDIKTPIREEAGVDKIKKIIELAVKMKPLSYSFKEGNRLMHTIGG
ncbi:MAG: GTP 3',8-cyclase MoaA [bacterium]